MSDARVANLHGIYARILSGKQNLTKKHGKLFLDAVCLQPDPVSNLQKMMSSASGPGALRTSLFSEDSPEFTNGHATRFLLYLQDPQVKIVYAGSFLQNILVHVTDPPIFWNALVRNVKEDKASDEALECFGWLLMELLALPADRSLPFYTTARDGIVRDQLDRASQRGVRTNIYRIKSLADSPSGINFTPGDEGPGGRHDNDSADIRDISILPSANELECKEEPYLRRATEIEVIEHPLRLSANIDNQFRLLREGMLREIKEELQSLNVSHGGKRRPFVINDLKVAGIRCTDRDCWSLCLQCSNDLLPKMDKSKRLQYIKETSKKFLKHESSCYLIVDSRPLVLVSIDRHDENLAAAPSIICVRLNETTFLQQILSNLKNAEQIQLMQLNTAIFAYEPVLRQLQNIGWLELGDELMYSTEAKLLPSATQAINNLLGDLQDNHSIDLQDYLKLPQPTVLDESQAFCLRAGLTQKVSLIQGPPGTGKSYIGALIAKALYLYTSKKMLVLSYTNHASVQYLEDLLDAGVPDFAIVRLGSRYKASDRTQSLGIYSQASTKQEYNPLIGQKRDSVCGKGHDLARRFSEYQADGVSKRGLKEQSEFDLDNAQFFGAFDLPEDADGMARIDEKGKTVDEFYLLIRWCRGYDAGVFPEVTREHPEVWSMSLEDRKATYVRWKEEIQSERNARFASVAKSLNEEVREIWTLLREKERGILRSKRIIGCTTTAAAKYFQDIQAAAPDILIVEEAGEILESHVLTALGPETQQLVLIGDHQQLRPKVHFDFSVAKGSGYDADVSLFERLVSKGYPHETLSEQHRMRPEISKLLRKLTYPNLEDSSETLSRPNMRGFQSNLIFVSHNQQEDTSTGVKDSRDFETGMSRRNPYEAKMTLACVKYLAQQGYNSEKIVVLTPYVAQLRLLYDVLSKENDPVLNDLDCHDLIQAGLMPLGLAKLNKNKLRISSVDNYQGEQSEIVIITLTRSNKTGDIGFLSSPERLNVLLSRARNGMILIGNAQTFLNARKGREQWQKLFNLLEEGSHLFEGFPVVCPRHPERKTVITSPDDFASHCPDGGCDLPCGIILSCGKHNCPSKCHQLVDHSQMQCMHVNVDRCDKGHAIKWRCFEKKPLKCRKCDHEEKLSLAKAERDIKRQLKLDKEKEQHEKQVRELNEEIWRLAETQFDEQLAQERKAVVAQKHHDRDQARQQAAHLQTTQRDLQQKRDPGQHPTQISSDEGSGTVELTQNSSSGHSPSEAEWARQKRVEDAKNDAIDALMVMTGLEDVKAQVLKIKAKAETAQRQCTDLRKERFGITMLGNPGTGKTTVARIYAKFLASIGVLPSSTFVETTGSRLANGGVNEASKHISELLQSGGGAFFIDEAYQLASGNSPGGSAILDFLLAEIENLTGKIVFILAGYNKPMEKFFQHNQGFPSRIPYTLQFNDYMDAELLLIFQMNLKKKFKGNMKVDDGVDGLYVRILIKRLGRGRGREGFGNARALENVTAKLLERQAERLQRDRVSGKKPDDFQLTKEDLIGPEPTNALNFSEAWKELQQMIGLGTVKNSIQAMLTRLEFNYRLELNEKAPLDVSLNRVFLGSPGTGKTTVAKLYGQVLKDIMVLSSGEVVIKNPADFVGSVIGESEKNTKAILESTKGKVLIIDEAYMLYNSNTAGKDNTDPFRTAVIDTIVAEVQSTPGEDRCVLLLGYRDKLEEMFKSTNPGLARRFPLDDAFVFQDFTDDELRRVLELKLAKQDLEATDEAKTVALEVLGKARRRMNFGNGGEVENLITRAKNQYELRFTGVKVSDRPADMVFQPEDFDQEYKRSESATVNCRELFKETVGCEDVIKKLEGYTKTVSNMRARKMDPTTVIPFTFIFKGPPGTGKTTTARKMGQIFYNMGLLGSSKVSECSASDLIGQYVGQTGPRTTDQLEKALGRVLFVDEAYRLAEGGFATEAVNELVDNLTKPKFAAKMIVILAGYTDAMDDLLRVNQGLASRFPEEIIFDNMRPEHCFNLCRKNLENLNVKLTTSSDSKIRSEIIDVFEELSKLRSWGNGRDVNTISNDVAAKVFRDAPPSDTQFAVTDTEILSFVTQILKQKLARERVTSREIPMRPRGATLSESRPPQAPPPSTTISIAHSPAARPQDQASDPNADASSAENSQEQSSISHDVDPRDDGVSDEIWTQLQMDKENQQREFDRFIDLALEGQRELQEAEHKEQLLRRRLENEAIAEDLAAKARDQEKEEKDRKDREEAHKAHLKALAAAKQEAEDRLRRTREALERRRREEARMQEKLQHMGVCPVGYQWIKQAGGYRCAGGSHFVSDMQLGI